jgi:hypothetical protein
MILEHINKLPCEEARKISLGLILFGEYEDCEIIIDNEVIVANNVFTLSVESIKLLEGNGWTHNSTMNCWEYYQEDQV